MDYQTQMNGHSVREPSGRRVAESAAELWHHILLLGELQTRLLFVELGEGIRQTRSAVVMLVAGCLLGLASVPVVLACLALVLVESAGMTPAGAFSVVAGLAILFAAGLIGGGSWSLRQQSLSVPRSRAEWRLNWDRLKETLRREHAPRSGMPFNPPRAN